MRWRVVAADRGWICGPRKVPGTSSERDASKPCETCGPRKLPWTSTECDGAWWPQTMVSYAGRERFHEPRPNEMTLRADGYSTWTSKVPLAQSAISNHRRFTTSYWMQRSFFSGYTTLTFWFLALSNISYITAYRSTSSYRGKSNSIMSASLGLYLVQKFHWTFRPRCQRTPSLAPWLWNRNRTHH